MAEYKFKDENGNWVIMASKDYVDELVGDIETAIEEIRGVQNVDNN